MRVSFGRVNVVHTLRRPVVVGSALAVVGVGLCLWGGQRWMKNRIESGLSKRLGLPVAVDSLTVGLLNQSAHGITVGSGNSAIEARLDHVRVQASPWSLLMSGRQGVERVDASSINVTVRTHHLTPRTPPQSNTPKEKKTSSSQWLPEFAAHTVHIALIDEQGEWASGDCATAALADGHLRLDGINGVLQDGATRLEVVNMEIDAQRREGTVRFTRGRIGQLHVQGHSEAGSILALTRTRRAATRMRQTVLNAPQVGTSQAANETESSPRWSRWLAKGAQLEVERADLTWMRGAESERLLQDASLVASSPDSGHITSRGRGKAASGGSIAWDAVLGTRPLDVRADVQLDDLPSSLLEGAIPRLPWHHTEQGRLSANLHLRTQSPRDIRWQGELRVTDAALASLRIAPDPVTGITVALHGQGVVSPLDHAIEIEEGRLHLGETEVQLKGSAALDAHEYRLDVDMRLPATPCAEALAAIPPTLLGDLHQARLAGNISGQVNLHLDSQALADTTLELHVKDRCEFVNMTDMADLRRFRQPFTHSVVEPDGSMFVMQTGPGSINYTYLEDISPYFVNAVLAHEDARFFSHSGFSPPHIRDALVRNLQEGRYVVGASTISMQLIKNLLLHREKTLARKLQEVLLTWYVERTMDKRDILELYLNVIEYGPGVYGIRHAAQHYFGRTPAELSPAEGAFFATILPSPKRYHEYYERGALSTFAAERVRTLLRRLAERGSCDEATVAYGLAEVEHFHFVRQGELAAPRVVEGRCTPLPYQTGFTSSDEWELFPTNHVYEHAGEFP